MEKFLLASMFFLISIGSSLNFRAEAQVQINEFCTNNVWVKGDMVDYDDFSDWIELHNGGSLAADVGGFYLTGSLKNPKKAQIPSGTSIPADGYLFIWADGYNGKKQYLHAGFKLDKDGEQLGLFDPSGKVIDSVTYGPQYADISMGRNPKDGSWCYFDEPTPDGANTTPPKQIRERTGPVTFSIDAGIYSSAQSVSLSSSDNSPIYYTTDGMIPNSGSKKYSGAISVSANTVIRARTIVPEKIAGVVATNTYLKESPHKIMTMAMTTDQDFLDNAKTGIFKKHLKYMKVPVVFECFETNGKPVAKFTAGISVGSLTNYDCPQKPLQVALKPRLGDEYVNYKFFRKPIDNFNRLRLRQGGDAWNTNYIADDLLDPISSGQMAYGWQAYRPVVLYINGKYYGLMDLREQFKGSYLKENYGVDTTGIQEIRSLLTSSNSETWEVVSGSKSSWDKVVSSISDYATALKSVDINSMIDYYVLESFACNVSWGHNEDFWWVPNGKWRWLKTDIDRCFEYSGQYSDVNTDIIHTKAGGLSGSFIQQSKLFGTLIKTTEFKNHFGQRYAAHLNSTFKGSRLTKIIDSIATMISDEMQSQISKWGSQGGIKSISAWQTELNSVKKFCNERGAAEIKNLSKDLTGGTAKLTITVSNPASGDIYIEGVRMCEGTSGMTFFKGAPLVIKGVPKNGCTFKGFGSSEGDSTILTLSGDQTISAAFDGVPLSTVAPQPVEQFERLISTHTITHNNSTALTINLSSTSDDHLLISLFNLSGRKITNLINKELSAGTHSVTISTCGHAAGVYLCRITTNRFTRLERVTIR